MRKYFIVAVIVPVIVLMVLGMKPRIMQILGNYYTIELSPEQRVFIQTGVPMEITQP
jgi:hypothetical protein